MAYGDIGAVIDTETTHAYDIYMPWLNPVTGDIFLTVVQTGYLRSVSIDETGQISSVIDSLNLGTGTGSSGKGLVHVSGDVYALAFIDATQVVVKTFTVDSDGNLGAAAIDTINLAAKPTNSAYLPHIIPSHKPNIYIVCYTDSASDGWMATIKINDDGSIDEPVLSSVEIEADQGRYPWLVRCSAQADNLFAVIISSTSSNRSRCRTFSVSDTGIISMIAEYLFDSTTNGGNGGCILHVSGDVYAIFWQGADSDGWIYTLSIDSAGNISAIIDSWEFETTSAAKPQAHLVSSNLAGDGQIFVLGYTQTGATGPQVFTVEILNNGTITKSAISTLTLVAANYARDLSFVKRTNGIYAVFYEDDADGHYGKIKSFSIEEAPLVAVPTVTTDPATEVGQTTATLNGTLETDGGEACDCHFEYGETTDYGATTATQSKSIGEAFSQEVRGLAPSRTYHFRAVANNSAGTSYGNDRTFRTTELSAEAHQALGKGYPLSRAEV